MKIVIGALAAVNLLLFILMGVDKARARNHRWRISERMLFLIAAIGGSLGGVLGMLVFRHKTKHRVFEIGFPLLLLLQAAALVILIHLRVLHF